jgi:uracil-DNA glycosylase
MKTIEEIYEEGDACQDCALCTEEREPYEYAGTKGVSHLRGCVILEKPHLHNKCLGLFIEKEKQRLNNLLEKQKNS